MSNLATNTTGSHSLPSPWRAPAQLAWGLILLAALAVFLISGVSTLRALGQALPFNVDAAALPGLSPRSLGLYFWILDVGTGAAFFAVAFFLFWRKRGNWLMMLTSMMLATFGGVFVNNFIYTTPSYHPLWDGLVIVLSLLGNALFVHFLYTFPNGRFPSRAAKLIAFAAIAWFALQLLAGDFLFNALGLPGFVAVLISVAAYGGSFFVQNSALAQMSPAHQQQVKWITIGMALALFGFAARFLPEAIAPALATPGRARVIFLMVAQPILQGTLALVPLTIGFSMLRYRLWEVDFVINRGLVYGGLTLVLGIAVAAELFLLRQLFVAFTGQNQATVALVIVAVIMGAAFHPLRRYMQRLVDRRVYDIQVPYQKPRPAPPPLSAAQIGRQIGPYTIQGLIGRGGMANVYVAEHPTLRQPVAVKVMLTEQAEEANFRARFEREARAIASLRHPNIVRLYDYGQIEDTNYMVMEYIDGPTLRDFMRRRQPLPLPDALALLADIGGALAYAHAAGLVHRDVKPSNVMVQERTAVNGQGMHQAILTDFGIVKMLGGSSALTQTGMVGTLDYIAPEQIRNARDVDGRADLYSLGVMAYELVTGQRPFTAANPAALLIAHLQQPAPDPRRLRPDLPPPLAESILRLLAKTPEQRYATADDFLRSLSVPEPLSPVS
jgi:tRNA A-37 threonylcarbamoyl transferase component Bud32